MLYQFAVVYKARNNKDARRDDIIKTLATLATQNGDYSHNVDLSDPDLTIVVEIVKVNQAVWMCITSNLNFVLQAYCILWFDIILSVLLTEQLLCQCFKGLQ